MILDTKDIRMCTYTHVRMYVCVHIRTYARTYVYIYARTYVRICIVSRESFAGGNFHDFSDFRIICKRD